MRFQLILTGAFLAAASPAMAQIDAKPTGFEEEAAALIDRVWDATLQDCGSSAYQVVDDRVVLELDTPQFYIAPTQLTVPATESGYDHQTAAIVSARRWRWASLNAGRISAWSDWQAGSDVTVRHDNFGGNRGRTSVQDVVLQFDLVRRNGIWEAYAPQSPVSSEMTPLPLDTLETASGLTCAQLAALN